jgi:hypothetical protein
MTLLSSPGRQGRTSPRLAFRFRESTSMSTPRQLDKRQHLRTRVAWPILIKVGTTRYLSMSVDLSTHGTKVRTNARLKTGTSVQLEVVPPEGPPIRVGALVWRMDADGLALLFSRDIQHRLIRTP